MRLRYKILFLLALGIIYYLWNKNFNMDNTLPDSIGFYRLKGHDTKCDYIYILGTQDAYIAKQYILSYIDTIEIDTLKEYYVIRFLKYKEGLPLREVISNFRLIEDRYLPYYLFEIIVNKNKYYDIRFRDGKEIIAECSIHSNDFVKGLRKKIILEKLIYKSGL